MEGNRSERAPWWTATGQTTFTTSTLAVGSHSITAAYQGDSTYSRQYFGGGRAGGESGADLDDCGRGSEPGNRGRGGGHHGDREGDAGRLHADGHGGLHEWDQQPWDRQRSAHRVRPPSTRPSRPGLTRLSPHIRETAMMAAASSAPYSLTVQIATTATAVTVSPSPAVVESPVSFVAKVTGNGGIPTGSVAFSRRWRIHGHCVPGRDRRSHVELRHARSRHPLDHGPLCRGRERLAERISGDQPGGDHHPHGYGSGRLDDQRHVSRR
jgi:hypothetical protein